jgi:hypothetical protein
VAKKAETVSFRQRNVAASVRKASPTPANRPSFGAGGAEVSRKVARSAETGRMVTRAQAIANPKGTVVETVKTKRVAERVAAATVETVKIKRKAKPQEQEKLFIIVPVDGIGWERPGTENPGDGLIAGGYAQMTKGEMLSMLAEEVLREPVGPEKTKIGGFKIPAKLAAVADLLYTTRQRRLDLNKHVEAMKVQEAALKDHLIDNLPKSDSTGVAGKIARAQVNTEDSPATQDWDAFYKHLKKTGQFDLMNKAINRKAIKERWAAGKEVPGIGHFEQVKISLTKVGGGK